jgi:hypothetical protein
MIFIYLCGEFFRIAEMIKPMQIRWIKLKEVIEIIIMISYLYAGRQIHKRALKYF